MKNFLKISFILLFSVSVFYSVCAQSVSRLVTIPQNQLKLGGHVGEQTDLIIEKSVLAQDYDYLVEPFRYKNETHLWQMEFWGKWMLGAVAAWEYTHNQELMRHMSESVKSIIKTQLPNGYIGNYSNQAQLTNWDIWGRKYVLLGLLRYHDITNDNDALIAARKSADYLISQVGKNKTNIIETGNYRGMASSSVLEPMVLLYNKTHKASYLNFAKYIVSEWETPAGPQLISKALAGVHVADRFPPPEVWFSPENGQKAYEMMSCYNGLIELYKVTGDSDYLKAVESTVRDITEEEINVAGSGTSFECWYHGKERQTRPTYHTMETCVVTTWLKLNYDLLALTGNPLYANNIETAYYNALMASTKLGGAEIEMYSPLEGHRGDHNHQCGMDINCCVANGPRGFMMIPRYAVMTSGREIYINLFTKSTASLNLQKSDKITIQQNTTYPEGGKIQFKIATEKPSKFTLALRIPDWSLHSVITVNGVKIKEPVPGNYAEISRKWSTDDVVELQLDMSGRVVELNNYSAILRGPIVLARDSRFNDGFVDEAIAIQQKNGKVDIHISDKKPEGIWLAFTLPAKLGTGIESTGKTVSQVHFCDFGSAGNTWNPGTRYKVWLANPLNVMHSKYKGY